MRRASRRLFPLIESIDVGQPCAFGLALFLNRPIVEGFIGMRFHRVLDDRRLGLWFRKTLPCKQVYTDKQAKKDRANQGQSDESLLS